MLREEFSRISTIGPWKHCGADFVRACAVNMHMNISEGAAHARIYKKTCRRLRAWEPRGADFARACAVEMHMDASEGVPYTRSYNKMSQAKSLRTPRRRLCSSLRSGNAHGRLGRGRLRENLQQKCLRLFLRRVSALQQEQGRDWQAVHIWFSSVRIDRGTASHCIAAAN